ncbi:MAG: hypothetical protein M3033_11810 [Acidobacteriota bacterium]|nr:hypothetical protein [Acidobacteriota bacterium]
MLVYQFQMQVDSKAVGGFISLLSAVSSADKNKQDLLEAGEKGNSSDLAQFMSYVKSHKDKSQTISIKWKPSDKNKSKFHSLKSADTFRLRLYLRLVNGDGAARWVDFAEIKDATVKKIMVDARDGQEVVEINYKPKSMDWDEQMKDQSE